MRVELLDYKYFSSSYYKCSTVIVSLGHMLFVMEEHLKDEADMQR